MFLRQRERVRQTERGRGRKSVIGRMREGEREEKESVRGWVIEGKRGGERDRERQRETERDREPVSNGDISFCCT
jgi:hypothetical protein